MAESPKLTREEVLEFLPSAPAPPLARVDAWLKAINASIVIRYRTALLDDDRRSLFVGYAADAIQRRLDKSKRMVDSENAGPFGVKWNPRSALGGWFLPEEITDMDRIAGVGGVRTLRAPAPDGVRFNNLSPRPGDTEWEGC